MPVEFKKATKKSLPMLIGLWGVPGSGKTLSSLMLARGIVGEKGKIAVIDTENERALFYANREDVGEYMHYNLTPPFTVERYLEAIEEAEKFADIIIVDSGSHSWFDEGGALEQAEKSRTKKGEERTGLNKWKNPISAQKKLYRRLQRSSCHIIVTYLAEEKYEQEGKGANVKIVNKGFLPIMWKKSLSYMLFVIKLTGNGKYVIEKDGADVEGSYIKQNMDGLKQHLIKTPIISIETGKNIAKWNGHVDTNTKKIRALENAAEKAAANGTDEYKKFIATVPDEYKDALRDKHSGWVAQAKIADQAKTKNGKTNNNFEIME